MMKLYFSPGACALASQIALREADLKFDLVKTDLRTKKIADGEDYMKINPKGYVPALALDDGKLLTEGVVILQWIADQKPEKNLLPKLGTIERYRAMEWLNFISTELHKGLGAFFNPIIKDEVRESLLSKLNVRLKFLDEQLLKTPYVLGAEFSVVDAYVYNIMRWAQPLKVDLTAYKGILGLIDKVSSRPSVRAALEGEGLRLH